MHLSKSRLCLLVCVLAVSLLVNSVECKKNKKKKISRRAVMRGLEKNLTTLIEKVDKLSNPVQITLHGMDPPVGGPDVESQGGQGGTNVHIHFNLPTPGSSSSENHHGHNGEESIMAESDGPIYAACDFDALKHSPSSAKGRIALRQKSPSHELEIKLDLDTNRQSRTPNPHGLHVHQYADFQNGCKSFGGHFNPLNATHAGPDDGHRHAGDWGNVTPTRLGHILATLTDSDSSLFGKHTILGRGIVLHEGTDDLGRGQSKASLLTGDAGGRIGCCVISVVAPETDWM